MGQLSRFIRGFLLSNGRFQRIDDPGEATTDGGAINNRTRVLANDHMYYRGVFTKISFPGAVYTGPTGINDHEDIVGSYGDPNLGIISALLLRDGVFIRLLSNDTYVEATAINNRGQILGRLTDLTPYLYDSGRVTTFKVPAPLGGYYPTFPSGINDHGTIIGGYFYSYVPPDSGYRPRQGVNGFVYEPANSSFQQASTFALFTYFSGWMWGRNDVSFP